MARIRTVKPEFWTSEQIVECSRDARLLFIGMWNFVDDGGVMPANARTLKMRVYPGDDDITSENIRGLIDELITNGLIECYSVENKEYWAVTGWHHQKIDRPNPKYPGPKKADGSEPIRRTIDVQSPPEGKGREGSLREGKEPDSSLRSESGRERRSPEGKADLTEIAEQVRRCSEPTGGELDLTEIPQFLQSCAEPAETPPIPECLDRKPEADDVTLYKRGKEVLGKKSGGVVTRLKNAVGLEQAMGIVELAAGKADPVQYIGGVLRKKDAESDGHVYHPGREPLSPELEANRRRLKGLDG